MAKSFEASVSKWVEKTKGATEAVFKQSAQEVFSVAQKPVGAGGNMPVVTGFLRGSLQTGLNGAAGVEGEDSYVAVIAGAQLGDEIVGGWTAVYARLVELGFGNRKGRFFMNLAVQQWQSIVSRIGAEAKARFR